MHWITGREAVREGAGKNGRMETDEGIIIFPADLAERPAAAAGDCGGRRRLPEFYPATPAEAFGMARSACLYADTYGTPILIRLEREVSEGRESMPDGVIRERMRRRRRREKPKRNGGTIPGPAFSDSAWNRAAGHGEKGVIVRGPAFLRTVEILNGSDEVRVLKLGTTWPVPEEKIRAFLAPLREILVLDETREEILTYVYAVKGKYDLRCRILPFHGEEARADDVAEALQLLLGKEAGKQLLRVLPPIERSLCGMPMIPEEAQA